MNRKHHVLNGVAVAAGVAWFYHGAGFESALWLFGYLVGPIVFGAMLPDLDVSFGKHRKTFHNLPFLAVVAVYPAVFGVLHHMWIGVAAHYMLDAVSGRGLAWFYPVTGREARLPVPAEVKNDSPYADVAVACLTALQVAVVGVLSTNGVNLLHLL